MAKSKIKLEHILLAFLFVFMIFLRFWKAADWFSFNFDEEYQAFLAWSQVLNFHPIWIGVSAGSTGFYLGPAFTYLNAILFFFSRGDPTILAYFAPILGLVTIFSIYYVISHLFSRKIAIYSSLVYAISPLLNLYDRRFWNPSFIPFLTIWLLYSLYRSKQNTRWFILSSIIMATSLHIHLSLLSFWPVIIYLVFKYFKKIHWSTWIVSIISYIAIISPLIVFDIVHNFDNISTPIRMFSIQGVTLGRGQLSTHLLSLWNSLSRFWYLQPHTTIQSEMGFIVRGTPTKPVFILSLFSLITLTFLYIKSKSKKKYNLLFSMIFFSLLSFLIFPGNTLEYYLLSFFTLFSICVGIFLKSTNQVSSWLLILIFAIFSTMTILTNEQSKYGLSSRKDKILKIAKEVQKPYSVILGSEDGIPYSVYGGWCYLFQVYTGKPTSCPADESFGWIYKTSGSVENSEVQVNLLRDLGVENVN